MINCSNVIAQVAGTPYLMPIQPNYLLDALETNPSFAFSTRKLKNEYSGFALRVRRSTDNAQADITFDENNLVSNISSAIIAVPGTSGLSVGNSISLTDFSASANMFVTIWYDQGINSFNAIQNTIARQPQLVMSSAGINNQYASVVFTGSSRQSVVVNQPLNILLTNSLIGSIGMIAKTTSNNVQSFSFGYLDTISPDARWFIHMNWDNNYLYADFGHSTDIYRAFENSINTNKYKQFVFIRTVNSKISKVSSVFKQNNVPQTFTLAPYLSNVAASSFGIGCNSGLQFLGNPGYSGNVAEFILFPIALSTNQTTSLEQNQLLFWGCN